MIDTCLELAQHAGRAIEARPELELLTRPARSWWRSGTARRRDQHPHPPRPVRLGPRRDRPHERGREVALKLTLLNPHTTPGDVDALLDEIVSAGA